MTWVTPPVPPDEPQRLEALKNLRLLDTPAEERFDRITRLARRVFGTPIALVGLLDAERLWLKSAQGLTTREIPRAISFCGHAILRDQPLIVSDARTDSRFAGNPLVTGDPGVRFYAGHPVRGPEGGRIGTLCVIDRRPRTLEPADLGALRDLAMLVENELNVSRLNRAQRQLTIESALLRQQAVVDPLTQIWNRRGILDYLRRELSQAGRQRFPIAVLMADVDYLKGINETFGPHSGDEVLRELAQRLRAALRPYDAVGRYGDDEFLVILCRLDAPAASLVAERVRSALEADPVAVTIGRIPAHLSIGVAAYAGHGRPEGSALVAAAEAALKQAKEGGRNRVVIAPFQPSARAPESQAGDPHPQPTDDQNDRPGDPPTLP
jgi:diguanylate cyclase (GGDEF)-like protein